VTAPVCIVTGASRGLGKHLAKRFWDNGYSLGLVGRDQSRLAESAFAFQRGSVGQSVHLLIQDLSDIKGLAELVGEIGSLFSGVDVLINNAAVQGPIGPLAGNDLQEWQKTLQVDLVAPVALCQGVIPLMKESGGGSIINLSGGGAAGPRPNFTAYAAAKASLVRFSETLAAELAGDGIRVNCIAPGAMKTQMLRKVLEVPSLASEAEVAVAERVFEQGGASMDRVAELALFLASDASRGITGKLISAVWDDWERWPEHLEELVGSDVYTLRRITGRDRGNSWGDK
jgi:NAD(P)-dependent dehydrogenase (short-subunit alcohol dehydrogenase family)